jgi:hypothetical protein
MTKLLLVLAVLAGVHHMTWTERVSIHHAVAEHLKAQHSPVKNFSVASADGFGLYARARITTGKTDPATVILKKEKGAWKVLVMGTMLDAVTLKRYRVPKELTP